MTLDEIPETWVNVGELDWITPERRFVRQHPNGLFSVWARGTTPYNGTPSFLDHVTLKEVLAL